MTAALSPADTDDVIADDATETGRTVAAIDALLPQTQCTKCGYPGCRPYAEAIARGDADINQCPPGGAEGIAKLARLLHRQPRPLNPVHGVEQALRVATIDEARCIGCTLCLDACPVDAIVGAAKRMHVVLPSLCTGCDLCVAPCPVDCIEMVVVTPPRKWSDDDALAARVRFEARTTRLGRAHTERERRLARPSQDRSQDGSQDGSQDRSQDRWPDRSQDGSNALAQPVNATDSATDPAARGLAGSASVHAAVQAAVQRAHRRRANSQGVNSGSSGAPTRARDLAPNLAANLAPMLDPNLVPDLAPGLAPNDAQPHPERDS